MDITSKINNGIVFLSLRAGFFIHDYDINRLCQFIEGYLDSGCKKFAINFKMEPTSRMMTVLIKCRRQIHQGNGELWVVNPSIRVKETLTSFNLCDFFFINKNGNGKLNVNNYRKNAV